MADEKRMFERVRELCTCTGKAIDVIAKECGIPQRLVAEMYMNIMREILNGVNE